MKFVYCPFCKGILKRKAYNLLVCRHCESPLYINAKPTSSAILANEKGEILLAKRKHAPKRNYWNLPGGFIDLGESAEEATMRELKEELGVMPHAISYLRSWPGRYLYRGSNYHTLNFVFIGKVSSREVITPQDDVSEAAFFLPKEIPFHRFAFPSEAEALKYYLSQ